MRETSDIGAVPRVFYVTTEATESTEKTNLLRISVYSVLSVVYGKLLSPQEAP